MPSAPTRVKDTPSTRESTCTSSANSLNTHLTMLYQSSCVLLLHVVASAAAFVPVGHHPTAYRPTTTARHADSYSYTYGSSPPPQQGAGGNGPKTDDGRVVRIQQGFVCVAP